VESASKESSKQNHSEAIARLTNLDARTKF